MPAAVSIFVSVLLMPLAVRLGSVTGLVDRPEPGGLKIHRIPVSALGGPAAIIAALIGLAVDDRLSPGLLAGVGLATAVGLVDDGRTLPAWPRVLSTGLAGSMAAIGVLSGGGGFPIVTGLMIGVACANAVNIVDGQDGLAGGLSIVAALSMALSARVLDLPTVSALGVATAAGLLGFLVWNRPPARLFLGNGGAYGVGILLAAQSVMLVAAGPRGFVAAGLCLGPLAFELMLTTVRRVMDRSSLVVGDRSHSYDLLAARLRSRGRATILIWCIGAASGAAGISAAALPLVGGVALAAGSIVVAVAVGIVLLRRATLATST